VQNIEPSAPQLELEIQSLLILHGSTWAAAHSLLQKYSTQKIPLEQIEQIATFCLHAGYAAELLEFFCQQIELDNTLPWGHFIESLNLTRNHLSSQVIAAALEGAKAQQQLGHLTRSFAWDCFEPSLAHEREMRRRGFQTKAQNRKNDFLGEVDMFKSQDLIEEEERVLQKLVLMFPRDQQIQEKMVDQKGRKALRLLDSKNAMADHRDWRDVQPELDPETKEGLRAILQGMLLTWDEQRQDEQLGLDFAVALLMWDDPEDALQLLPLVPQRSASAIWLRAECQLRSRRFVELLSELIEVEKSWSSDAEVTFAMSYLRAQCLWGLGRRFEAIDLLEGLVNVRPSYRSASGLLALWKGQES